MPIETKHKKKMEVTGVPWMDQSDEYSRNYLNGKISRRGRKKKGEDLKQDGQELSMPNCLAPEELPNSIAENYQQLESNIEERRRSLEEKDQSILAQIVDQTLTQYIERLTDLEGSKMPSLQKQLFLAVLRCESFKVTSPLLSKMIMFLKCFQNDMKDWCYLSYITVRGYVRVLRCSIDKLEWVRGKTEVERQSIKEKIDKMTAYL